MKKLITFVILFVSSMVMFAQEDETKNVEIEYEAIKFMGIPMEGPFSEFRKALENKGLEYLGDNKVGDQVFKGSFAGYNAHVIVSLTPRKTVYQCGVIIGEGTEGFSSWKNLIAAYNELKSLLTQKYGEPAEEYSKEEFERGNVKDSDKLYELTMGRCDFHQIFRIPGKIESKHVTINARSIGGAELSLTENAHVQIVYSGFKNSDEIEKLKIDDV